MTFGTFTPRPLTISVDNLSPLVRAAYAEIEAAADRALQAVEDRYRRDMAELIRGAILIRNASGWSALISRDGNSMQYFDETGLCRLRMGVI